MQRRNKRLRGFATRRIRSKKYLQGARSRWKFGKDQRLEMGDLKFREGRALRDAAKLARSGFLVRASKTLAPLKMPGLCGRTLPVVVEAVDDHHWSGNEFFHRKIVECG